MERSVRSRKEAASHMRHVTIKDIARIAGVSTSTVSRALSGSKELSEATRERIVKICNEQGYRVNALARSLIRSRTNVIGLIVPEVTNPFYAEVSLGIETHARQLGYNVMLCNSQQDTKTTEELFGFLTSHQVDGIILANSHSDAPRWIQQFAPHLPTVLLGTPASLSGDEVNSVCVDNLAGGRLAAEYLLSLGHRSIAYLGHRSGSLTHQLRLRGFMEVLGKEGLTPTVIENTADSSSIGAGYELSRKLFNEGCPHTAIFAATDSLALGAMQAADEFGISIPDDLSLLGFDNIIYSSLPKITLSTIDQRKSLLAEAAVDILTQIIESDERDEFTHRMILPALIRRSSCASIVD